MKIFKNKYNIMLILLLLILISCSAGTKQVRELPTNDQREFLEKEINSLISDLMKNVEIMEKRNCFSFEYNSDWIDDPNRRKIWKECKSLDKKEYKISRRLYKIGPPVIPYVQKMLKNDLLSIKLCAIHLLGELARNREEKEVILDLLELIPFTDKTSTSIVMIALYNIGKPAIPYIIDKLANENSEKRIEVFALLRTMTMLEFKYYNPEGTDIKERNKAIEMIKDWWEKNKDNWKMPKYK